MIWGGRDRNISSWHFLNLALLIFHQNEASGYFIQNVFTEEINKTALSSNDDKRMQ